MLYINLCPTLLRSQGQTTHTTISAIIIDKRLRIADC